MKNQPGLRIDLWPRLERVKYLPEVLLLPELMAAILLASCAYCVSEFSRPAGGVSGVDLVILNHQVDYGTTFLHALLLLSTLYGDSLKATSVLCSGLSGLLSLVAATLRFWSIFATGGKAIFPAWEDWCALATAELIAAVVFFGAFIIKVRDRRVEVSEIFCAPLLMLVKQRPFRILCAQLVPVIVLSCLIRFGDGGSSILMPNLYLTDGGPESQIWPLRILCLSIPIYPLILSVQLFGLLRRDRLNVFCLLQNGTAFCWYVAVGIIYLYRPIQNYRLFGRTVTMVAGIIGVTIAVLHVALAISLSCYLYKRVKRNK